MGSAANMVRSLVVIGVLVAAYVAIVARSDRLPTPAVDAVALAAAQSAQSNQPYAAAVGLPAGWSAESAILTRTADGTMTWQIVYRTPANDPVAVKQAVDPKRAWLVASTAEGVEQGTVSVAAATWRVFRAEDKGQVAVVQDGPGTGDLTTVVLGQAPQADVEALAAALRPSPLSGPGSTP